MTTMNLQTLRETLATSDASYRAGNGATWGDVNDAQNAISAALCGQVDRAEYEVRCAHAGVEAQADETIQRMSYTLSHFDMPTDPTGWLAHGLVRQRLNGLRQEARRPEAAHGEVPAATCSACGAVVARTSLMNASRRAGVCPDCYDQYSD